MVDKNPSASYELSSSGDDDDDDDSNEYDDNNDSEDSSCSDTISYSGSDSSHGSDLDQGQLKEPSTKRQCIRPRKLPERLCKTIGPRDDNDNIIGITITSKEAEEQRESSNFIILSREIIKQSHSTTWDEAKLEWKLVHIHYKRLGTCLCTHHPITDHCVIKNLINDNVVTVGNVCIKKFNTDMLKIEAAAWDCLHRFRTKGINIHANPALLDLCHMCKILRPKEIETYTLMITGKESRKAFDLHHEGFKKGKYLWRQIRNIRIMYGFHSRRPQCNCKRNLIATPCYVGKKTGNQFFYGCWEYHGPSDPGCGFFQWCPSLADIRLTMPRPMNQKKTQEAEEEEEEEASFVMSDYDDDYDDDYITSNQKPEQDSSSSEIIEPQEEKSPDSLDW